MSDFKLNISIGDVSIQLEGEGDLVQTIFNELRENGLGELNKIPVIPKTSIPCTESETRNSLSAVSTNCEETNIVKDNEKYPSLKEVALKSLPKSETEWILLYAFYASDFGKKSVSRSEIKEMYNITNRMTTSRSNNFFNSLTSAVSNNYLTVLNNDEYTVRQEGKDRVKDLDLSTTGTRKGLKDYIGDLKPTSNINISTSIIYYLQNIYQYEGDINGDIIFTCWRELGKRMPNDLAGNLRDICSSKYGYANVENGNYSITTRGINLIEHTLKEG